MWLWLLCFLRLLRRRRRRRRRRCCCWVRRNGQAFYLPWAYVGLAVLMGQSPLEHLMGIAAGHVYIFFYQIFPVQYSKTIIWTPTFL